MKQHQAHSSHADRDVIPTLPCARRMWLLAVATFSLLTVFNASGHPRHTEAGDRIDALVGRTFSGSGSGGVVLVAKDDAVVFRRAYGMADVELGVPMRTDHVLAVGSITKQFTAVAILQLVAQGRVSLDGDVREHVPEFPTHGYVMTVDQVLSHTAGLPNIVDREDFELLMRQDYTLDELLALTRDMPLHFEPGTGYRYSDSGYFLLAAIIERVSGQSYGEYVESKLFRPLDMDDTWYGSHERIIPRRASGYSMHEDRLVNAEYMSLTVPHAAGAVFSTVDDLYEWDVALRADRVIPAELLNRARSSRRLPDGTVSGYGYGWKLCSVAERPTIEHGGFVYGFQANMLHLPDDGLTIIVLVNNDADRPNPGALARRIARLMLTGDPEPRYATLTAQQRQALIGRYEIAPGDIREISERDGRLYVQRGRGPAQLLTAMSPTRLALAETVDDFMLDFEIGADGRARQVRASLRCEPVDTGARINEPAKAANYWNPSWSPDDARILFESDLDGGETLDLYMMQADGSGLALLRENAQSPAWSPDGTRTLFISAEDGDLELYVMNADGTGVHRLTNNGDADYGASWSPDGTKIIYNRRPVGEQRVHDLFVINADGTNAVRLTDQTTNDLTPRWSPDGKKIAFVRGDWPELGLYVMDADGANARRLSDRAIVPAWSPDGTRIAFSGLEGGDEEIYTIHVDGTGLNRLTTHAGLDRMPTGSPDGRRIAFVSERHGRRGIFIMNADGSNPERLAPH